MYKKILAAVNEHLNSVITARYALNLARACSAKLYLCFVAEKGMSGTDIEKAEDAMKRIFSEARDMDMQVESISTTGRPVQEIKKVVREEKIDLVFVSARRADVKRKFYRATTASELMLRLPCSVALTRVIHMGRVHPRKILIPLKARIDNVPERAYFTAKMAEGFSSKVFVFHTPKPITRFFHGEIDLTPMEWDKRTPADVRDFMGHINKYRIDFEGRLTPGRVARTITIEAASKRHDLIIMGATGRSLLSSLLRGNPVEKVLRETPCDLIILKPRHKDDK
ncbi:MAG: universal stress protein [Nitrospirae bacterium]|nr:universal stress protein [Nitrospirota bacterium]